MDIAASLDRKVTRINPVTLQLLVLHLERDVMTHAYLFIFL